MFVAHAPPIHVSRCHQQGCIKPTWSSFREQFVSDQFILLRNIIIIECCSFIQAIQQRLEQGKVPCLCALVKAFSLTEADASVLLKDPTGAVYNSLVTPIHIRVDVLYIVTHIIIWLALWAGKMNQIVCCDWLPGRARKSYFAHSGLPAVSCKKCFTLGQIINPLVIKICQSRCLDIGRVFFFCEFMDWDGVEVINAKKRTWPTSSHLDLTLGQ